MESVLNEGRRRFNVGKCRLGEKSGETDVRSKVSGVCVHKYEVKANAECDCKRRGSKKWQSQIEPSLFEQSITGGLAVFDIHVFLCPHCRSPH